MKDNPWPPTTGRAAEIEAYASSLTGIGAGKDAVRNETAHRRAATDAYTGRIKADREVATLSHVAKGQTELLARLRQIDEVVGRMHARLVGDTPEDLTDSPEREPRTLIEGLVAAIFGHLDAVNRLERRLNDLDKVLQ